LCEDGRVLADPDFIGCVGCARRREVLHGLVGGCIRHQAECVNHSTTFTMG
jgi:hypothetical protein